MEEIAHTAQALEEESPNEATTRLLIIDQVLVKVLGWEPTQFNPEEYVDLGAIAPNEKGWLDYHLKGKGVVRLVVEAKRTGSTFSLSESRQQRILPLRTLIQNHGPALRDAVEQAKKYCVNVGTAAFVVTNGHQWIASLAFQPNMAANRIQAVVFQGFTDILGNLGEFLDTLSPSGLANQHLLRQASGGAVHSPVFARSAGPVRGAPPLATRNYLVKPLEVLMRSCFGDLTSSEHRHMLDECYVEDDVTTGHVAELEAFAGSNRPAFLGHADQVSRQAQSGDDLPLSSGVAFLVVGRAGSGKSTFLAVARSRLEARGTRSPGPGDGVVLFADLLRRTQTHARQFDHDRLIGEICGDLLREAGEALAASGLDPFAYENLSEVFAGEIRRLRNSLSPDSRASDEGRVRVDALIQDHIGKPETHLKAYLGWLRRRGIPATVVLDNVDRGTVEFERVVFQLGQSLAHNTAAAVVTTLRDSTFHAGKTQGFLDTSQQRALIVSPPPFVRVAQKRFDYARHRFHQDPVLGLQFARALGGSPAQSVYDFAAILSEVVLDERFGVRECVESLAGTNIRRALELLERFATSPHTDLNDWFQHYARDGRGQNRFSPVLLEWFLRSVMRGREQSYAEGASPILNLFQVSRNRRESHFVALRLLQFLEWRASDGRGSDDVPREDVIGELGGLGIVSTIVAPTLDKLGRYGLVSSLTRPEPPWSRDDAVRLGAAGRYYLHTLIYNREYLSNIVDDLVFYEDAVVASVEFVRHGGREYSLERLRLMLGYLLRCEALEMNGLGNARPGWAMPVMHDVSARVFGESFVRGVLQPPRGRLRARGRQRG